MARDECRRRVTARDLLGLVSPGDPAAAPGGERVAFTLAESDFGKSELRTRIHVAPAAGGAIPSSEQWVRGLHDATAPLWSPDGSRLGFLAFRPQPHEDEEDDVREDGEDKQQVFALRASGGEAERLTEAPEGVEAWAFWPDGSGVVTLGPAPRPAAERGWRRRRRDNRDDPLVVDEEIPLLEIRFHPLEDPDDGEGGDRDERRRSRVLLPPCRGVVDFDVSPDGRLLAYATNHTGRPEDLDRCEVILRDLETGEERAVSGGRGGNETGPLFTRDGRFLVFEGWADPGVAFSRQELLAVDLADPEAPPRLLLAGVDRDVEAWAVLPDGRVAAAVAWGMESRVVLVDPATGEHEVLPLSGVVIHGIDAPLREGRLAVIAEWPDAPAEVCLLDPAGGGLERLTDLNPGAREWVRSRRVRIAWENEGFRHEGLVVLPPEDGREDAGAGPPPLVAWLHGGPHWRAIDTFRVYEAEALAARGFAVFLPNYRGSSGYGERYSLANRGDLGGADARDVLAGVAEVGRRGLADTSRAAVAGASYGGYLVNWLLATSDAFRAGISIAGIFDLAQDWAGSDYCSWEVHYLGGRPWEKPDLYRERSPLLRADRITAPVLVLHGLEDDNTLFTNGKALHRALVSLGRTTELVLYPREGHGIFEPAHRLDAHLRIVEWLERHVVGREAIHVPGRHVERNGLRLVPLGYQVREDYSGVRPPEGRMFLEVSVLLRGLHPEIDTLRLRPAGPSADVVLEDEAGGVRRPVGVPVEVHGQAVLFASRGELEAWTGEDERPASLPFQAVFEVPAEPAVWRLRVFDLPPIVLEVTPPED